MEFEIEADIVNLPNSTDSLDTTEIPVINAESETYSDFFRNYLLQNTPCIIKNISLNWSATKNWLKNGEPNIDYLQEKYGNTKVMIYDCSDRYFNSQKCKESNLHEYLDIWRSSSETLYYLKDWHLKLQHRQDEFYQVPIFFSSDWLNEYFTNCLDDDYRFVYMGLKGTWTPLHADVFNSYSWSVNICGQKRWIFFPPGEEQFLKDKSNNLPYDIEGVSHSRKCFEVIQNAGEAIFVPSGWYHQVWNLRDTISINHNWVNGCNIETMWQALKNNYANVRSEIADCNDMEGFEEHCQIMLKALFGINYDQFYDFLRYIATSRLEMMHDRSKRRLYHDHIIGTNHVLFDLSRVYSVLKEFLNCDINKIKFKDGQCLLDHILKML
ncbi:2-oxoglutarate and iron-dependent oxygenase JMJD4 [Anthonomus grandis grandis]|uniref:2-oxoglutarate and iron-dependent oxygenase JMJD4 n=1 Tax=Anthonomus grandis grandis TaxID=2921223 RepID=UPI0021662D9E|nr:2-oxoglutarate and iron-dependent oxygenase JMJD4 [Anthonomus grandis grandis]